MAAARTGFSRHFDRARREPLGYMLFDVIGPADEKGIVPVAGYLVYRIATNCARVQMVQNFQFLVHVQFLVQQLHQLLKTACAHIASQICIVLTS